MERVLLSRCEGYEKAQLDSAIDTILSALVGVRLFHGQRVLLKPNLISSRGAALACTSGPFIAAAARWFLDHGARVSIGDSPAFGTTASVLKAQGIEEALRGLEVVPVRFATPMRRLLDTGVAVKIAEEALSCDCFVNLPKFKAHNQMYMTGAVKNCFGTVVGMRKAMLHMTRGESHRTFADILVRLPGLLPSGFSLMDGVEAMHRSGPMDGEPLATCFIAGSANPIALDSAVLDLPDLDRERSPLWQAAKRANLPGWHHGDIELPFGTIREVCPVRFLVPQQLNPIRFNPLRFMVSSLRRIPDLFACRR